jgi:hypothetical protein
MHRLFKRVKPCLHWLHEFPEKTAQLTSKETHIPLETVNPFMQVLHPSAE